LKPGGSAILFEPQEEIDLDQVVEAIRTNLADESWLRRWAAVSLNKFGLRWGRTFGLKLYSLEELEGMAKRSRFSDSVSIERFTLQNLPIFARIALIKPGRESEGSWSRRPGDRNRCVSDLRVAERPGDRGTELRQSMRPSPGSRLGLSVDSANDLPMLGGMTVHRPHFKNQSQCGRYSL
jgi:hypothetical protein